MPRPLVVSVPDPDSGNCTELIGAVINISRGGVRVLASEPFDVGQQVKVAPEGLKERSYWPAWGEVVWVERRSGGQYAIGIKFRQMLPEMGILDLLVPGRADGR